MKGAPSKPKHRWLLVGAGAVLLAASWWWVGIPRWRLARDFARINAISHNLRIFEGVKEQWTLEHHTTNGAPVTAADLAPYAKDGQLPQPVAGEIYALTPVGEWNTVTLTRKLHNFDAGQVFTVTSF